MRVKSSIILPTPHAREAQFKPEELCLFLSQTRVSRNDSRYLGSVMFHPYEERIWVKRVLPKREDVEVSHLLSVDHVFHILHDLAFRNPPTRPVAFSVGVKLSIILPTPHAREAQFKPEELCLFSPKPASHGTTLAT